MHHGCKDFLIGDGVRSLPGTFPHVKIREWTIKEFEVSGDVMLEHTAKNYTLEVAEEDIERI